MAVRRADGLCCRCRRRATVTRDGLYCGDCLRAVVREMTPDAPPHYADDPAAPPRPPPDDDDDPIDMDTFDRERAAGLWDDLVRGAEAAGD